MADNLQIKTEKLIKYANEKFGTNEADLRSIIDSAEVGLGGEYNLESVLLEDGTQKVVATFVGTDGKEVVLDLPEEFGDARTVGDNTINSFFVDKNTILIGLETTNITGLWKYSINENTWEQLIEYKYQYKYFQLLSDRCLIGTENSPKTFVYYINSGNTEELKYDTSSSFGFDKCFIFENHCLFIDASYGVLVYDLTDNTVTRLASGQYTYGFQYENKCIVVSTNNYPMLLCDVVNKTVKVLYENAKFYSNFYDLGDEVLIGGGSSTASVGILKLNKITELVNPIFNEYYNWTYFHKIKDKCLCSTGSSGTGLWVYNQIDGSFIQILTEGYSFNYFTSFSDGCLISGTGNQTVYRYEYDTDKCYAITSNSSGTSKTKYSYVFPEEILFSQGGSAYRAIYRYNLLTNEVSTVTYSLINSFKKVSDTVVRMENTDKSVNPLSIDYDTTTKTAKLAKYYIGKV